MAEITAPTSIDTVSEFQDRIRYHLKYTLGKIGDASRRQVLEAVSLAVREAVVDGLAATEARYQAAGTKRLYYLSMEFLVGRSLGNTLYNLGVYDIAREAVEAMGYDLEEIREVERDAALGNGGLGRLAACFLDSLATLDLPGFGYGINYEYGLFRQEMKDGWQVEKPDAWRELGTPWQLERREEAVVIPLYGRVEQAKDATGEYTPRWVDTKVVVGVPHDMPVVGYGGHTVNYLRLYSARSSEDFDMQIFNQGDYVRAVEQKISSERISKVLYPSDSVESGKELRLIQEYFFVACSLRDVFRRYLRDHNTFDAFPGKVAIQLNDTHPALAVAELMRLFVDEYRLVWDEAWRLTVATLGYTNHTLLPEALEKWPVALMEYVLPRHLQIIYEINARHLDAVSERWPGDEARLRRMSIIEEDGGRYVRMAHLSIVGSHSVNGVAALHSELVRKELVPDFYALYPERFNNKTNGVTQRRWLLKANPRLADLVTDAIGSGWTTELERLRELEPFAEDAAFREAFADIKHANKERLTDVIAASNRILVDPSSLFDVQIKRIHEYKRQLLNALHIIHQYLTVVEDGRDIVPRTYLFAGKAAPGYQAAKLIIRFVNAVAERVNGDPRTEGRLRVAFLPDYRVSLAEKIIPAADLSEQISTAGKEASGTGNMKLAMNGALTIGTYDGANIEIAEEVGEENIYIFGLRVDDIARLGRPHDSRVYYERHASVRRVVDAVAGGLVAPEEPGLFRPLVDRLLGTNDPYFHLADLMSYIETQDRAAADFTDRDAWMRRAILNVARTGKFSSDRTIRQYAEEIWDLQPVR